MADDLFFYRQTTFRRTPKRFRKTPEELPQSLRFAHLNPKVAAFLANKEKEAGQQREEDGVEGELEGDQQSAEDVQQMKKSLLPDINQAFNVLKNRLDIALDHDEDSQRYLFEETKFSAPNILFQLAKVLYLFEGTEPFLPKHLYYALQATYADLIADVSFVPREWQVQANKKEADKEARQQREREKAEKEQREKEEMLQQQRQSERAADEEGSGAEDSTKNLEDGKRRRRESKVELEHISEVTESRTGSRLRTADSGSLAGDMTLPSSLGYRRESSVRRASTSVPKPKSRLDKFKLNMSDSRGSFTNVPSSAPPQKQQARESSSIALAEAPSDTKSITNQPYTVSTIQFMLSNKQCDEKGWIVHPDIKTDTEKETVLMWATHRLQQARMQGKEQLIKEKELGLDKPSIIRYYGDSKKEAVSKMRKGSSKGAPSGTSSTQPFLPTFPVIDWKETRKMYMCSMSDGSTTLFYPSGRMAVVTTLAGQNEGKKTYYTLIYEDNVEMSMLGCFTPQGNATCYHPNGIVRFLSSAEGGSMSDTYGSVVKQWQWPPAHGKLPIPITIQLNNYLSFRCSSHSKQELYFSANKETVKFKVGQQSGATEVEDLGQMMSGLNLSSMAANENPASKKKTPQKTKKQMKPKAAFDLIASGKYTAPLSNLRKYLEFPEKTEYDEVAGQQLARLQRKVKNLSDDWLEHYRLSLGILSPDVKKMGDTPTTRKRDVKSAVDKVSAVGRVTTPLPAPDLENRAQSAMAGPHKDRISSAASSRSTQPSVVAMANKVKFDEVGADHDQDDDSDIGDKESNPRSSPFPRSVGSASSRPSATFRVKPSSSHQAVRPMSTKVTSMATVHHWPVPTNSCPVALHAELLGDHRAICRCNRHRVPYITDLEFDDFIKNQVPVRQLIVISISSSLYPQSSPCDGMLEQIHSERNRNRTRPCLQCRNDPYRILKYDVATAAFDSDHSQPLLLARHNVVPGMFLIYQTGQLLFCDHIFNGYGNARKDFQKQLMKTMRDSTQGHSLPKDFRFSPLKGQHGMRAAWGGEIGGAGVDRQGNPGTAVSMRSRSSKSLVEKNLSNESMDSNNMPIDHFLRLHSGNDPSTSTQLVAFTLSAAGAAGKGGSTTHADTSPQRGGTYMGKAVTAHLTRPIRTSLTRTQSVK